jgi:hypothetical protein
LEGWNPGLDDAERFLAADPDSFLAAEREGEIVATVGDQFNVGEALAGLSAHAARDARWSDAARLAGASAALHEQIGAPPWASVTAIQDRALADARDALGSRYAAHLAEGRRLSAEDAVARLQSGPAEAVETSAR